MLAHTSEGNHPSEIGSRTFEIVFVVPVMYLVVRCLVFYVDPVACSMSRNTGFYFEFEPA
ncbi:hypothetical protein FB45DRAFT_844553 [Roridomyces roridus]|uniref:Uncharacterized protein n=1 Tax=Roridomyces roridus TaxID=1738132 RepID=A0AAD7B4F7_9AGAR|nr:hypothetical protein FB45DRAFT_844553 [Roridomyces roridus]